MLEVLNGVFIEPLIFMMNIILNVSSIILSSYGLGIIALSIVVNILLLPIYMVADRWQLSERLMRESMSIKEKDIKHAFKGQERFMMLKTLYRQHGYHPLMPLKNSIGFLIQVPFFFAAYQLLTNFSDFNELSFLIFSDLSKPDQLISISGFSLNIMPFVMTGINILSAMIYTENLQRKDKVQLYLFAFIFLLLLYNSPVSLVLYWTFNNLFSLAKNLVLKFHEKRNKRSDSLESSKKLSNKLSDASLLYPSFMLIAIIILLYIPIATYSSEISFFTVSVKEILIRGLSVLFWGVFILFIWSHYGKSIQIAILNIILLFLVIFILINSTWNILNVGFLDQYIFSEANNFFNLYQGLKYDLAILLIIGIVIGIIIWGDFFRELKIVLTITLFSYGVLVAHNYFQIQDNKILDNKTVRNNVKKEGLILPDYTNDLLSFSKTDKNILILMLDAFTGEHVGKILREYPEINEALTGFTWYPDTMSNGAYTYMGEPAIHGGFEYTPDAINARSDSITSIEDEITKGYNKFARNFGAKNDYDVVFSGTQFADCEEIYSKNPDVKLCTELERIEGDFIEYYIGSNKPPRISIKQDNFLIAHSLYQIAPYSLKEKIYRGGRWLGTVSRVDLGIALLKQYASFFSYPTLSNTNSKKPTFKYIQSTVTHLPWVLSRETCEIDESLIGQPDKYVDGIKVTHYSAEVCALKNMVEWINWMKKEEIYDNTMIVLVSDHGHHDNTRLSKAFENERSVGRGIYPGNPSALLMVKDFNQQGLPKTVNNFMNIADTGSIVCTAIEGCDGFPDDARKIEVSRTFIYSDGHWSRGNHNRNSYNISHQYRVKNSMYDKNNWEKIK